MRTALCFFTLTLLLGMSADGQEDSPPPIGDAFVGLSVFRSNSAQQIPEFTGYGGIGTLGWNINNHIGIEAEFGGYHNGNVNNLRLNATDYSYLFGPRVSYGRTKRIDPYVHALFGIVHVSANLAPSSVLVPTPAPAVPSSGRYKASDLNLAAAFGGGVDIRVQKHILIRPAQIDLVLTRFGDLNFFPPMGPALSSSTNKSQLNFRYAFGFVFTFDSD